MEVPIAITNSVRTAEKGKSLMQDLTDDEIARIKENTKRTTKSIRSGDLFIYFCPVCGKRFSITVQELWAFKRYRNRGRRPNFRIYLCSYGCTTKYDKVFDKPVKLDYEE